MEISLLKETHTKLHTKIMPSKTILFKLCRNECVNENVSMVR